MKISMVAAPAIVLPPPDPTYVPTNTQVHILTADEPSGDVVIVDTVTADLLVGQLGLIWNIEKDAAGLVGIDYYDVTGADAGTPTPALTVFNYNDGDGTYDGGRLSTIARTSGFGPMALGTYDTIVNSLVTFAVSGGAPSIDAWIMTGEATIVTFWDLTSDNLSGSIYSNCEILTPVLTVIEEYRFTTPGNGEYVTINNPFPSCNPVPGAITIVTPFTYVRGATVVDVTEIDINIGADPTLYDIYRLSGGPLGIDDLQFGSPMSSTTDGTSVAQRFDVLDSKIFTRQ